MFFFSSGGVEERWSAKNLATMRANVFVGFPLGGLLSLAIAAAATIVLMPAKVEVDSLGQIARCRSSWPPGRSAWRFCSSASSPRRSGPRARPVSLSDTALPSTSAGKWGKFVEPLRAARFHTVLLLATVGAIALLLTPVDPIMLTEYSVVFSAIALPLTYLPILIVANDRTYLGDHANGRVANALGSVYLVVVLAASVAAIPLMLFTKAGQ